MNISKIKKKFEKIEKEYLIWKYAIGCYERYANIPYPEDIVDATFIAYLLNDSATDAAKSLNDNGLRTPTGTKFNSNYITNTIDKMESSDNELNIAVKGMLSATRSNARAIWG